MKHLTQFIAEKQNFLVNNKLNKSYSSKTEILYTPKTKLELTEIIKKLINSGETNLNCIDVSKIDDMKSLFIKYGDKSFGSPKSPFKYFATELASLVSYDGK